MEHKLYTYENGDFTVELFSDGTKIRSSHPNSNGNVAFPESMDLKITDYCDIGCLYCHEKSTVNGIHGTFNPSFFDGLPPGFEVAIGGGDPLSHPNFDNIVGNFRSRGFVPNVTFNTKSLLKPGYSERVISLIQSKQIFGVGISYVPFFYSRLSNELTEYKNTVIHMILGIHSVADISVVRMKNPNAKILFLGYKNFGRGKDFYKKEGTTVMKNIEEVKKILPFLLRTNPIAMDNLAIEQTEVLSTIPKELVERTYMGGDGTFTMYADLARGIFAKNSTQEICYPIDNRNVVDCFQDIRG